MAVLAVKEPGSLKIKLDLGIVQGKQKTKSKTYSNVKINAANQDIFDVAESIMALQEYNVLEVVKQDFTTLNA